MSKKKNAPSTEATAEPKPSEAKKEVRAAKAEGLNGVGPYIPAMYEKPRHFSRVMAPRGGGPWPEQIVSVDTADVAISEVLSQGYDLLMARPRGIVTDGIFMTWLVAKPKGHPGQGFKEIKHVTRTIKGNLGAIPPAMTAQGADALLDGMLSDGYRLFHTEVVTVDMNGQAVLWVLVR